MRATNIATADTPIETMAECLAEQGYLVIERLAVDECARTLAELTPAIDAAPFGGTTFLGTHTRRVGRILKRSSASHALAMHSVVMALCDRLLMPSCARYQLNFTGVMHLEPGAAAQVLHRDGLLYPFLNPAPVTMIPTMWALRDFTADNGATRVVPGSHRWEHAREPFEDEVAAAVMPAGSVLLYLSGTLHGGGENVSNTVRTGLAFQYSLGWLRQEENQYLANPPEVARHYPEALARLIGYDFGGPYLGFVDGGDPYDLLRERKLGAGLRSTPEIDAAAERMALRRFGDEQAVATPEREGQAVGKLQGPP